MTRKILLTGAFQYSEEQLEIIENLGWEITFVQNELEEVDFPVDEFEAVVCNGLFLHNDIRKFKKLKLVQATSAGLERLPIKYMEENSISYFNAKGVYSIPMAEWAVMNILMLYKNMPVLFQKQKAHLWEKERNLLELTGKTVVIVGFGDVGQEIAKRIKPFGVKLIVVNRSEVEDALIDKWVPLGQLNQILPEADVVITSIALTKDTKHLLDGEQFSIMKKDSVLVNISRGAVINQKVLIEQLDCGWFRGVALDVFEEEPLSVENPLWDMERVIVTPHNSFVSDKTSGSMFEIIKKNLE